MVTRAAIRGLLGVAGILGAIAPAEAQPAGDEGAPLDGSEPRGRLPRPRLSDPRLELGEEWPAGTIKSQMDQDGTMIPFGKGAVFVPAMTTGLDEPPVEVLRGEKRMAEGTTGARILLDPGTYTLRIGSGASQQRITVQATVKEMSTTVIPVSWAALSVHVVDVTYASIRSSYELIRTSDREYMGLGFGTDEQAGEPISTWVLTPGLYKIVRVGDNYRARRDFVTVRLLPGKHTHFLLVLDEDTGEFAGGGEVPPEELFRPQDGFFGSLVAGGDVTMNVRNNIPGLPDGYALSGRGFIDGRFSLELFSNPLILRVQVESGVATTPESPVQKTIDRADFDALYLYRIEPWIGPYVRFGVETNLFPGERLLQEPFAVVYRDPAGEEIRRDVSTDAVQLSPSFGFASVREGVGLNVRAFKSVFAELNLRVGFGARHRITNDLFELDRCSRAVDGSGQTAAECQPLEEPGITTLFFRRIQGNDQIGVETAMLATARITRFLLLNLEVDSLLTVPFENSIIEARASANLKLTSFLSVNYVVRYVRDVVLSPTNPDRLQQDILLRFSVDLL